MNKLSLLICILITLPSLLMGERPSKPEEYQQIPPGTFFSITNNNSQNLNLEETQRSKTVTIKRPDPVDANQPPSHYYHPDSHYNSSKRHSYGTEESSTHYYTTIKNIPSSLFTLKNGLIALGVMGCTYSIIYIRLLYLSNNAKKTHGWGSFQEHIPPSDLKSLETLALADGIIEEIKLRYPLVNPSNLMSSLLLFNKDIDDELEELNAFVSFYTWLVTCKLSLLFPNQEKVIIRAQQKIQRLHILKDAIAEWINEHVTKLMCNQPVPRQSILSKRINTAAPTEQLLY